MPVGTEQEFEGITWLVVDNARWQAEVTKSADFKHLCTTPVTAMRGDIENWAPLMTDYLAALDSVPTWDTSNVTDMTGLFVGESSFNQPIGHWNTSKVTTMELLLAGASSFNQPIGSWNTSKVTSMSGALDGASSFNQPLAGWNTSKVTNMDFMLYASGFNQSLAGWDVSKVCAHEEFAYYSPLKNSPEKMPQWPSPEVCGQNPYLNAYLFDPFGVDIQFPPGSSAALTVTIPLSSQVLSPSGGGQGDPSNAWQKSSYALYSHSGQEFDPEWYWLNAVQSLASTVARDEGDPDSFPYQVFGGSEGWAMWLAMGTPSGALTFDGATLTGTFPAPKTSSGFEAYFMVDPDQTMLLGRGYAYPPQVSPYKITEFYIIPNTIPTTTAACVAARDPSWLQAGVPRAFDYSVATKPQGETFSFNASNFLDDVTAITMRQGGSTASATVTAGNDAAASNAQGQHVRQKLITVPSGLSGKWVLDARNTYGVDSLAILDATTYNTGSNYAPKVTYTLNEAWMLSDLADNLEGCGASVGVGVTVDPEDPEAQAASWGNWMPVTAGTIGVCSGELGYCEHDAVATNCPSWAYMASNGMYNGCLRRRCDHPTIAPSFIPGCT